MIEFAASYECLCAAGRDPNIIQHRRLLVAGGGNVGSNLLPSIPVLGIDAAYIDPDHVNQRNLAHSPFLDATPRADGTLSLKAELLAHAHVEHSRTSRPVAYWAGVPIQAVPWGVLRQFDGLIVGIDDPSSRAWAVRVGAILGVPTIVAGLFPPTGHFIATSNRGPELPCYFCLRTNESPTRASCSLYADQEDRINPALQTAAAATMNVAIDAMVRFWHGDYRYDGTVFRLCLDDGAASRSEFRRNPECHGPHERLPEIKAAPFSADEACEVVLELGRADGLKSPVLELPSRYIVSLPCRNCGSTVAVEAPEWRVSSAPTCESSCSRGSMGEHHIVSEISSTSPLRTRSLRSLGIGPLGLCIVSDDETDERRVYELPGNVSDVLHMVTKK